MAASGFYLAVKGSHPNAKNLIATERYDSCLHFLNKNNAVIKKVDKLKVAQKVIKTAPNYEILNLGKNVEDLIEFIRAANEIPEF